MKNLYEIICNDLLADRAQAIKGGGLVGGITFNFEDKNIKSGGKYLVKNGEVLDQKLTLTNGIEFVLSHDMPLVPDDMSWKDIQPLYENYINSKPSESNNYEREYFRPKTADELSFEILVSGTDRVEARYRLEAFLLLGIISGRLTWESNGTHWFWRGDDGLIIYRSWFI